MRTLCLNNWTIAFVQFVIKISNTAHSIVAAEERFEKNKLDKMVDKAVKKALKKLGIGV